MNVVSVPLDQAPMDIGDMAAFHGNTLICRTIIEITGWPQSHLATITEVKPRPLILEAHQPRSSVDDLAAAVGANYDTTVWIFHLSSEARAKFDQLAFFSWCRTAVNRPYDLNQAIAAGVLDWLLRKLPADVVKVLPGLIKQDVRSLYCSELVAAGYQAAGIIPKSVNVSRQTPGDMVALGLRLGIFDDTVHQVKGALLLPLPSASQIMKDS